MNVSFMVKCLKKNWVIRNVACLKSSENIGLKLTQCENYPEPYTLNVGDLSDITVLTTPAEFNEKLEIKLPGGTNV